MQLLAAKKCCRSPEAKDKQTDKNKNKENKEFSPTDSGKKITLLTL